MDNGDSGKQERFTDVVLRFDHDTALVHMKCENIGIALLQMMLHEATIQAEMLRRKAAMVEMQQQAADAALRASLANDQHRRV